MVHPLTVTSANRLSALNNFGTVLNRWHRTPFFRMDGTALTQFRSVRRGGGERCHSEETDEKKEREGDEQRHGGFSSSSSSSAHFGRFSSSDPEQIRSEFHAALAQFLQKIVFSKDKKSGEQFEENLNAFIRDFNKRMSDFEVEKAGSLPKASHFLFAGLALTFLGAFIAYRLFYRNAILPEHRAIVAQQHTAITFTEFVQDYLAVGEVRMIYFYPNKSIAVAILHPDAVIRGQPFYGSAVLIRLDPFTAAGTNFLQGIADAQNRLGIAPREHVPVAVQFSSMMPTLLFFIGWALLMLVLFNRTRVVLSRRMFKVKRKGDGREGTEGGDK